MATYNVKVLVEFQYEVEADDETQAEAEGWKYEDYKHTGEVDSIEVSEVVENDSEDYENDSDNADGEWLTSAGFGTDEDYE